MDFTFFYTKKQLNGFLNSRFTSTVLCPQTNKRMTTMVEDQQNEIDVLPPQLESILEEIAATKMLIDPVIEQYIESVKDESILELLKYNNKTWSWREKSFLMRASVLSLGREFTGPLLKASSAIELMGMSFCLIDDIIDESSFYDLKQTTWAKYGYKETICASEILTSLAHKALIDSCCEDKISGDDFKKVMQIFQTIQCDAYASQFMDIESEKTSEISEEHYFEMISKFPGTLYAGALQIACLLSGVDGNQGEKLQEFGRLLGMINQIRDDLIEIVGEEKVIGKKIGADILRNKKRLPLIVFLQNHSEYRETILNANSEEQYLDNVIRIMRVNGVVESCIEHIKELTTRSILQIRAIRKNKWTDLLEALLLSLSSFDSI